MAGHEMEPSCSLQASFHDFSHHLTQLPLRPPHMTVISRGSPLLTTSFETTGRQPQSRHLDQASGIGSSGHGEHHTTDGKRNPDTAMVAGNILIRAMHGETRSSPSVLPTSPSALTLNGSAALRKVGLVRFPVYQLAVDDHVLGQLGRPGWWRIFFGRGQPIELADGRRWRLRAVGMAGAICPVIVDTDLKKVAQAIPGPGGYGLNGRDWAYVLSPWERHRFVRANQWILREHEREVALVTRSPWEIATTSPVPVGAAILALTLSLYSIPGESDLGVPRFRW